MKPHPRIRTTTKWAAAALSVLMAEGYLATVIGRFSWFPTLGTIVDADDGALVIWLVTPRNHALAPGLRQLNQDKRPGWCWRPRIDTVPDETRIVIPLWPPLGLVAIPTGLLFYRDHISARRRRAGQCLRCGYDRSGLAAASTCPECDAPAPTPAT